MIFVRASGLLYVARMIAAGTTNATATAHGDMWNRGETRDRSELRGRTPSRPCEKSSRAAAAWMASVQLMKASTITSSANLWATFPKEAVNNVFTGAASAPDVTAAGLRRVSRSGGARRADQARPT